MMNPALDFLLLSSFFDNIASVPSQGNIQDIMQISIFNFVFENKCKFAVSGKKTLGQLNVLTTGFALCCAWLLCFLGMDFAIY